MRCQVCGDVAAVAPEHDHVRVGLCEQHIREYMAELKRSPALRALDPNEASA